MEERAGERRHAFPENSPLLYLLPTCPSRGEEEVAPGFAITSPSSFHGGRVVAGVIIGIWSLAIILIFEL